MQQLFQLAFVVAQVALGIDNLVFVLSALRGQLGEVGTAHFPDFYECLSAFLVFLAGFEAHLMNLDGLGGIKNLHVELGDLLLDGVGGRGRVEFGLQGSQFVEFDVALESSAVPQRPVRSHAVTAVIKHLIDALLHIAVLHLCATRFRPRLKRHAVTRRGVERGQQRGLALPDVFLCAKFCQSRFLERDVVLQRVVDTFAKCPLLSLCRCAQKEQGGDGGAEKAVFFHIPMGFISTEVPLFRGSFRR